MKKRLLNKSIPKLLSVMLASVMLFVSIPMSVIGEGLTIGQIGADDNATLVDPTDSFYEDVAMRDEFSKHYVLENGERYAVIFPEAVHYEDGGEWKEVDNRLTYNAATGKYVSANPKFTAAFADNAASGELVSISDGEHTVSWGISFAKNSGGELMNVSASAGQVSVTNGADTAARLAEVKAAQASLMSGTATVDATANSESIEESYKNAVTDIGKASSGISYASVMDDAVSLRYSVSHGKVEEDIILRSKSDFASYTMTVNTGGLAVTAETDGSVSFKTDDGERVFTIDAPWMKDSAYGFSKDIDVTVTQTGNTATVTYTPGAEWLNSPDRVYPVLIDPTVTIDSYSAPYVDTHILQGETDFTYYASEQYLYAGMSPVGEWSAYIKLQSLPVISNSEYTITEGSLRLYIPSENDNTLTLHKVTSSWIGQTNASPSSSTYQSSVSATAYVSGIYQYSFDLDSFFLDINNNYDGNYENYWSNYHHGFKITSSYSWSDDVTTIYSSNSSSFDYRPIITITYSIDPITEEPEDPDLPEVPEEPEEPDIPEDTIDSWFVDNGIYNIKLNYEGADRYATVSDGFTVNGSAIEGSNVYQDGFGNSEAQSFNFKYLGNGKYIIKPLSSFDDVVLGFDLAFAEVNGYANVQLYDESLAYDEFEEDNIFWRIEYINSDEVRISSYVDPALVLTLDINHGTLGSPLTTDGNIIVREFDSYLSLLQTWQILSGGNVIHNVDDIRNCTSMTLNLGANAWLNAAITNIDSSIVWSSSDNNVATVDQTGCITPVEIGTVTITVSESRPNGSSTTLTSISSVTITVIFDAQSKYCFFDTMEEEALENNNGSIILPEKDPSDEQAWRLCYYDGYYTIESVAQSGKYLTAPIMMIFTPTVSISDIPSDGPRDTQLWRITAVGGGNYKIQSKREEDAGSTAVLSCNTNSNGIVLVKNDTGAANYRWVIKEYPKTLHIDVYADEEYRDLIPFYVDYINDYMEAVRSFFLREFYISVEYSNAQPITTYADECGNTPCTHSSNSECKNSNAIVTESYHHNNINNVAYRIPKPDMSQTTTIVFSGHTMCRAGNDENEHEIGVSGKSLRDRGVAVYGDIFSKDSNLQKTIIIHEILHWYGAPDHYDNVANDHDGIYTTAEMNDKYSTSDFNDTCIFGESKDIFYVFQNNTICEGCKNIIRQNLNKYDH